MASGQVLSEIAQVPPPEIADFFFPFFFIFSPLGAHPGSVVAMQMGARMGMAQESEGTTPMDSQKAGRGGEDDRQTRILGKPACQDLFPRAQPALNPRRLCGHGRHRLHLHMATLPGRPCLTTDRTLPSDDVLGEVVIMLAFQASGPGSIPGGRMAFALHG